MLNKLSTISKDLLALAELVKDVQKQQTQLTVQLSETKERVNQNSDLIRSVSEQFKSQVSQLLQAQVDQTDFIRVTSTKHDDQMRAFREDVSQCNTVCSNVMKQTEGLQDTLQTIHEAVVTKVQSTNAAVQEVASLSGELENHVPHLTHDPIPTSEELHNNSQSSLNSTPLNSQPLNSQPLNSQPLNSQPLNSQPLNPQILNPQSQPQQLQV